MSRMFLICAVILVAGCGTSLPSSVPNGYWKRDLTGAAVYCNDGRLAAHIVYGEPFGDSRACVFKGSGGCERFINSKLAVDYVQKNVACMAHQPGERIDQ